MNWAEIQTTIRDAFRIATADANLQVTWEDSKEGGYWQETSNVKVDIISVDTVGRTFETHEEEAGQLRPLAHGVRKVILQVRCETQDQDLAQSAHALAETIRTGVYLSTALYELRTAELALLRVGNTRNINYKDSNSRLRSAAVFEMDFNTTQTVAGILIDWIQSVSATGTITKEDGVSTVTIDIEADISS